MEGIIGDLLLGQNNKIINNIPSKNHDGFVAESPKNIIYGQVLLNPSIIDFGQITFDQTRFVDLWNATTETQNLTSVTENNFDGLTIEGDTSGSFFPSQTKVFKLDASVNGGNVLDATAIFNFVNLEDPVLSIFGTRILIFDFLPNYSNQNVLNYSYRTEIQTFYDGSEERHPVYLNSDFMMSNNYLVDDSEARKMKNILQNFGTEKFVAPIYQLKSDIVQDAIIDDVILYLDDVVNFEDGMTIKINKDSNSVQNLIKTVDVVNNTLELENPLKIDIKKGSMVFPILDVEFQDNGNSINKVSGKAYECSFSFRIVNMKENLKNYSDIVFDEFDGLKILDAKPNVRNVDFSFNFIFEDFKDFGAVERITQMNKADNIFQYQYVSEKDEINFLKKFFYENKGMLKEFLVPSFFQDFKLVQNINAGSVSINVENNDDVSLNPNSEKREYIRLKLKNGSIIYRKILGKQINIDKTQALILNEAFTENINVKDVVSIEYMYKCRFASDTLSLNYYDYNTAEITLSFKTL